MINALVFVIFRGASAPLSRGGRHVRLFPNGIPRQHTLGNVPVHCGSSVYNIIYYRLRRYRAFGNRHLVTAKWFKRTVVCKARFPRGRAPRAVYVLRKTKSHKSRNNASARRINKFFVFFKPLSSFGIYYWLAPLRLIIYVYIFFLTAKRVQYRKLSNPPGKDTKDQRLRNFVFVRQCSKNIYYSFRNWTSFFSLHILYTYIAVILSVFVCNLLKRYWKYTNVRTDSNRVRLLNYTVIYDFHLFNDLPIILRIFIGGRGFKTNFRNQSRKSRPSLW